MEFFTVTVSGEQWRLILDNSFCEFMVSRFKFTLCFSGILDVICLSFNMFQVFQIVTFGGKIEEFMLHLAYIIPILVYMFIINYLGQEITDHNNNIFLSTYNTCWYMAPLSIQKLILLLLQRGNKPYTLSAAGLFVASLQFFAKVKNIRYVP
ncbi:putative odorant receptor 71a [Odontomachus brunneus]|uniref:putative odorant receptor 71a n=1 Tax=Odontomachus brunneus TaxID=486640 RepID=UPI0013F2889A|nr:putative odorant receptor 71a [Odontomachus brunneus]